MKSLIQSAINKSRNSQLLYIPFARTKIPKGEEGVWGEGWIHRDLDLSSLDLLDARSMEDIKNASDPIIFVGGGPEHDNLYDKVINDEILFNLVKNCSIYIGESAGAMMSCEYRRTYNPKADEYEIKPGFGILKDTIIEPHYIARHGESLLQESMRKSNVTYGIGIDSLSGVYIENNEKPSEYELLGNGIVELVKS